MSNHLAIATVTATLRLLLQEAIDASGVAGTVTTARPDGAAANSSTPRVNVYLYQVTPNATWRNSDLPTRNDNGGLVQKPRVALDLHYLLTFYGDEALLQPQLLLGSVARTLHAKPVLSRGRVRDAIQNPIYSTILAASNLAEDIELVKFTPTTLSLEELSKLWAVFFQTQYTLSVTYQGTVVLIETDDAASSAPPVLERNIYAVPFRAPWIAKVRAVTEEAPILIGGDIVIEGRALQGDVTEVRFGASDHPPVLPSAMSDTEARVTLPGDLRAGVQGLQVEQQVLMGTPPLPHAGFESNVAAFVLAPDIAHGGAPVFAQTSVEPSGLINGTVTVNFIPRVGKAQRVRLLLNEFQAPPTRSARGYVFAAPNDNGVPSASQDTANIAFEVVRAAAGQYLIRVQVDGAESRLERDVTVGSPSLNQFTGPRVTIA